VFHLLSYSGLGRNDKVGNEVTASVDYVSLSVPHTHTLPDFCILQVNLS